MPPPKAECEERRPYETVNRRLEAWTERIRERYNRTPTTNELLAIDHIPCLPSTQLFDHSESGIIIYERLRHAEKTGNPSLLEEAGRLLMLQMTNVWTPATFVDGDFENCDGGARNDASDGVRRLNRVFLQQYQERQDGAPVLQKQHTSCSTTYPAGAAELWNRTTTGEHIPFSNYNSSISIDKGNKPTDPSPSRAAHQNTFQDVFHSPSAIPRPVPTATTTNSPSTASNPCQTPSTTTSTSSLYLHQVNPNPANPQTPRNPVLQAHSINGNTYIIPITLHFANTVSNSTIAVHIPGMASAEYPPDLVSVERKGEAEDVRLSGGTTSARGGFGDESGTENGAGISCGSARKLGHDGGQGGSRVGVRAGEGGEPIGAVGRDWVGQGRG